MYYLSDQQMELFAKSIPDLIITNIIIVSRKILELELKERNKN